MNFIVINLHNAQYLVATDTQHSDKLSPPPHKPDTLNLDYVATHRADDLPPRERKILMTFKGVM